MRPLSGKSSISSSDDDHDDDDDSTMSATRLPGKLLLYNNIQYAFVPFCIPQYEYGDILEKAF